MRYVASHHRQSARLDGLLSQLQQAADLGCASQQAEQLFQAMQGHPRLLDAAQVAEIVAVVGGELAGNQDKFVAMEAAVSCCELVSHLASQLTGSI